MITQRIIPRQEVLNILGLSSSTLDRRIHAGLFVPPISLLERRKGWPENEVVELVTTMVSGVPANSIRKLVSRLIEQRQLLPEMRVPEPQQSEINERIFGRRNP